MKKGKGNMAYECLVCDSKMKKTGTSYEPWQCTDCHIRTSESCHGGLGFDVEYFDDYSEDSDVGCTVCGNLAYPDCKSSCPMFND